MTKENAVSIILPHFRTRELVKLCLSCLRRFTPHPHEVIVVDNGSGDHDSLDYLKTVSGIRLMIVDPDDIDPDPNRAHRNALQIGYEAASYPYILSLHTDTFVLRNDWLSWMIEPMLNDPTVSATGTFKLSYHPFWYQALLDVKHHFRLNNPNNPATPYIRSHCALYNQTVMEKLELSFISDETAGREIFFVMQKHGYKPMLLPVRKMSRYIAHINHGTMVINPELCERKKTVSAGEARIARFYASKKIQSLYNEPPA